MRFTFLYMCISIYGIYTYVCVCDVHLAVWQIEANGQMTQQKRQHNSTKHMESERGGESEEDRISTTASEYSWRLVAKFSSIRVARAVLSRINRLSRAESTNDAR